MIEDRPLGIAPWLTHDHPVAYLCLLPPDSAQTCYQLVMLLIVAAHCGNEYILLRQKPALKPKSAPH